MNPLSGTLTAQAIEDGGAPPGLSEGKPGKSWPLILMFVTWAWADTKDGRVPRIERKARDVANDFVEIVIFDIILDERRGPAVEMAVMNDFV